MVLRVHYVFQNTSLALSNRAIIAHGCIIFMSPIWIIVMVILQSYEYQTLYRNTSIFLILVVMIGSIHLLIFFNHNLLKLLKVEYLRQSSISASTNSMDQSQCDSKTNTTSQTKTVSNIGENIKRPKQANSNKPLLDTIAKHNLLTSITIFMFLIFVVLFALLSFGLEMNDTQKYALWWIQCLSINMATFCIFLGFNINNFWYDVICGKCNKYCTDMCGFSAQKSVMYIKENNDNVGIESNAKQRCSGKGIEVTFDHNNQKQAADIEVTIETFE